MFTNLKALREKYDLSQEEFGKQFDVKKATYSNYENGNTEPASSFWIAVSDKFHVSIDYLLGQTNEEHGTKYGDKSELEKKYAALDEHGRRLVDAVMKIEAEREKETPVIDFGMIRHYLYSPAAGPSGQLSGEDYEDIPRTLDMPKNADYCLTVSGDSMEPVLYDGQMVFVSEDAKVNPLEIGVWFLWGETYVKQYGPEPDGSIVLLSANPDRKKNNVIIPAESVADLLCYGKVLGIKKLPRPVYNDDL